MRHFLFILGVLWPVVLLLLAKMMVETRLSHTENLVVSLALTAVVVGWVVFAVFVRPWRRVFRWVRARFGR